MIVAETAGETVVTEGGSSPDTFDVRLDEAPAQSVTVDVSSNRPGEATATPSSLVFTAVNFSTPQPVIVQAVDDDRVDGDQTVTITLTATSSDTRFNGLTGSVTVTVHDNETAGSAGIQVTESDGSTVVSESGSQDVFDVQLNTEPSGDVTISVAAGDATEATASPASLTFDATNWNSPQTVTVTGVNDSQTDGNQTSSVTLTSSSTDANYNGKIATVTVTTVDDEAAGLTVTENGGSTVVSEDGTSDEFTVRLNSQPSANVVLRITSDDASEGSVAPTLVTFTPADWPDPKTITVTGNDDGLDDGNITWTVTIAVEDAASAAEYRDLADRKVNVTTLDNDPTPNPGPGPTCLTPTNGTKLLGMGTTVTWVNQPGTTQYQIQVIPSNNDGPGINLIRNVESTYTIQAPDFGGPEPNYVMLPDMTYTWRVRNTTVTTSPNESDWSQWCTAKTFETGNVSSATITLSSPSNGNSVSSRTPTLMWSNSNRQVFYYEVQVSKDDAFGNGSGDPFLYWELRHGGQTSPLNSYTIPSQYPLEANTTYYWRVRPRIQGDGAPVAWTSAATFRAP